MTRSFRRLAAVAVCIPALVVLAGCATSQAGSAAVVGDRRIPVSDVQQAYSDVRVLAGPDSALSQSDVLNWLILEPYITEAASAEGLGVSVNDARLQFDEVKDQLPEVSDPGIRVARAAVALNRLQNGELPPDGVQRAFDGVMAKLKQDGVYLNPRYGSRYDLEQLAISQGTANWLVPPAPPTPEPGAVDPGQGGGAPTPSP